jgi:hypothetical protein
MASEAKQVAAQKQDVHHAEDGVKRAIGQLIAVFGDADLSTETRAAAILISMGAISAGPLATATTRTKSNWARGAIMTCLRGMPRAARPVVLRAMTRASKNDPDPALRAKASSSLLTLMAAGAIERIASE